VQQADVQRRGFLDFDDFKRFVKLLKARPEVKRLYKKLCSFGGGSFSFQTFERFMRDHQKVSERAIWLLKMGSYVE
jgi:phosphatidylinositol phospholipase C delta